jgi:hypothetical protein
LTLFARATGTDVTHNTAHINAALMNDRNIPLFKLLIIPSKLVRTLVQENLRQAGRSPTPVFKRRTSPLTHTCEKESGNHWPQEKIFDLRELVAEVFGAEGDCVDEETRGGAKAQRRTQSFCGEKEIFGAASNITLSLGIGVNTALFAGFNLLLRPSPIKDPDTVVKIERQSEDAGRNFSYLEYVYYR